MFTCSLHELSSRRELVSRSGSRLRSERAWLRPGRSSRTLVIKMSSHTDYPPIMVNSCSGKMGHATAESVVRGGLKLVPFSFTGESEAVLAANVLVHGIPVELIGPQERQDYMDKIKQEYPNLIIVDYTLPTAVNGNAQFYCSNGIPFVLGTTGGDREKLLKDVQESKVYAVIAPNMGKQVVAFQAMIELLAGSFPGSFSGYSLRVVESHQKSKADTSGTAKAVVASMKKLGLDFEEKQIEKVRNRVGSMERMGVPDSAMDGHAFHTYTLTSPDGTAVFEFKHNVVGRQIYAEGTVDACLFLASKIAEKSEQKVFNMIDVLKAGSMR